MRYFIFLHTFFDLTDWMTVPQADGTTEVILLGPGLKITLQTAALRGPASAAKRKRRRRKPNTRRRPKNTNMGKRRAPKTNLKNIIHQMVKGQCLQKRWPEDPVPQLDPFQVHIIHRPEGDAGPRCRSETHDPTLGPTHPVGPDLEGGHTRDPEAFLGPEVDLCLDPDPTPILNPGQDLDRDQDLGPGTDPEAFHHPEKGLYPDLHEKGKQASPNLMSWSMRLRSFQRVKSHLSPDCQQSRLLKVSLWSRWVTVLHHHAGNQAKNPGSPPTSIFKRLKLK